jgi:hypothetical protein
MWVTSFQYGIGVLVVIAYRIYGCTFSFFFFSKKLQREKGKGKIKCMHTSNIQHKIRWATQQAPKEPTNTVHKDSQTNKNEPKR